MVCSKDPDNIYIKTNEDVLTQVPKFKYITSILTEDGKNKEDNKYNKLETLKL
jgi:hypothetical protein